MRLGVVPDNTLERLALIFGAVPPGVFESWFGIMLSRTVMAATKLDIGFTSGGGPGACHNEVADWYREAGLEAQKPRSPRMLPDLALHVGRKPA